ncbi:MAG: hypothetical protein OEU32_19725, partial [Acidimicrobiia bacterium]|nr:hypothetical protein [Acidimicrobiia bacterium]
MTHSQSPRPPWRPERVVAGPFDRVEPRPSQGAVARERRALGGGENHEDSDRRVEEPMHPRDLERDDTSER